MTAGLCRHCGLMMSVDLFGDRLHPTCDAESQAAIHRANVNRRKGQIVGAPGRRRALRSDPESASIGLCVIRKAAHHNVILSADTVREDLDVAGVKPQARGGLCQAAVAARIVTPIDDIPSGGESAHGKRINRYRSLVYTQHGIGEAS